MKKQIALFVSAFAVGALLALAARSARHDPYADHQVQVLPASPSPMVDNTTPKPQPAPTNNDGQAAHSMDHSQAPAPEATDSQGTTNTICPICGMPVDETLPTATFAGKRVGFGCRICPPKFDADPERYGPAALRNEEAE